MSLWDRILDRGGLRRLAVFTAMLTVVSVSILLLRVDRKASITHEKRKPRSRNQAHDPTENDRKKSLHKPKKERSSGSKTTNSKRPENSISYGQLSGKEYPLDRYLYAPTTSEPWPTSNKRLHLNYFSKLGGSSVKSRAFLHCLAYSESLPPEIKTTVHFFRQRKIDRKSPFSRTSLAADVGWSLRNLRFGNPDYQLQEQRKTQARYALLFFGGNDVQGKRSAVFGNRLRKVVDSLLDKGAVPILGSVMPRGDSDKMNEVAKEYNLISQAIAREYALVYVDFYRAAERLPGFGLARDGIHPNVYRDGSKTDPCRFDEDGLQHGNNLRNYLTVRALATARKLDQEGKLILKKIQTPHLSSFGIGRKQVLPSTCLNPGGVSKKGTDAWGFSVAEPLSASEKWFAIGAGKDAYALSDDHCDHFRIDPRTGELELNDGAHATTLLFPAPKSPPLVFRMNPKPS